ncbi:molybdopterin molybdotransferase MoeA [Apibacter sp. HY039]|uniref:molybdopterin molybdotransferase MoeA n=1 Tax=Apibacter sp. HY039 TaxID=2501476 RepID=UPI000FEBC67C|nr:molybdopterin molybdotransferase MoeA [Apibacter sp. HY039]
MEFITVNQARTILNEEIETKSVTYLSLTDALYHYTAKELIAGVDVPGFDNSAMDGYAFAYADFEKKLPLKITHVIKAGDTSLPHIKEGEAARIFTGAPMPDGADTVVMQEKVKVENNQLFLEEQEIYKGLNVRLRASQTRKGEILVSENTYINSGLLSLLAGFGFDKIPVYSFPDVGILVTGSELVEPGKPLQPGQIYESNSPSLQSVLRDMNITSFPPEKVKDDKQSTIESINDSLNKVDVLLITGGISVGDYDFVKESLQECGVKQLFYKVQQKPGKPLFFGKKDNKYVFALPGNPASVLSCFYQYVRPFLEGIKGNKKCNNYKAKAVLDTDFYKKNTLTLFLKGYWEEGKVRILSSQESYKMDSFTIANCWIELDGQPRTLKKGEEITVWKI